jgi:hypothetical protein
MSDVVTGGTFGASKVRSPLAINQGAKKCGGGFVALPLWRRLRIWLSTGNFKETMTPEQEENKTNSFVRGLN